jgi:hypothetical protein
MARRWSAVAVLVAMFVVMFVAVGINGADAATTRLRSNQTWTHVIASGAGSTSTASATWSVATPSVRLALTTGTLAAGRCVTVFFDWGSTGHHDGRALRDCRSQDSVSMSFAEPTPNNITGDPQKLGVCFGPDNKQGTCASAPGLTGTVFMDWSIWPDLLRGSPCDLSWGKRSSDGSFAQFLDPDPMRPTSLLSGLC